MRRLGNLPESPKSSSSPKGIWPHDRHFYEMLNALPAAIYTTDAAGSLTFYNDSAAALWGQRPKLGDHKWCGSFKLFRPDGTPLPHDECPMAVALKTGRPVRGIEAVAERPDGTRVQFIPFPTPLFDESGNLVGAVNLLVDATERDRADLTGQRLASIIESSDDAIISKDLNGIIASWNRGAERLFGYTADEVIGQSVAVLIPADRQDEEPAILERIRRGERIDHYETVRRRKDGSLVEISLAVSPVKDAQGKIIGASKIARDITERKMVEKQRDLLLMEMNHRIKNTLATVQAIATQTLRSVSNDEHAAFIGRLRALAGAHDLLMTERWDRASVHDVVGGALKAFQDGHQDRFSIAGPDVWLNPSRSLLLTLALHELGTNAAKYGALSNGSGNVRIEWKLSTNGQADRLTLHWHESGGPPVQAPARKGFGSMLIEHGLAEQGEAFLEFKPEGLACKLNLTL
jgi:two-component system, chemotaxis family, CheB/CheR fusion protein